MFYDLNVSWISNDPGLQRTLAFLGECRDHFYQMFAQLLIFNSGL